MNGVKIKQRKYLVLYKAFKEIFLDNGNFPSLYKAKVLYILQGIRDRYKYWKALKV